MISGTTVHVSTRSWGDSYDALGNRTPVYAEPVDVDDVLVAPGASADLEAGRPEGVTVAFTLHFPRTWTGSLEGAKVTLDAPYGGTYRVIGDPRPYMDANCPTRWHMPVEVEACHG